MDRERGRGGPPDARDADPITLDEVEDGAARRESRRRAQLDAVGRSLNTSSR
jgi:hypothetical protein